MTLKIGGGNYDNFYGNSLLKKYSNNSSDKTGEQVAITNNIAVAQTAKPKNLPTIPNEGYFVVGDANDTEYDAAYRALMNAARRAGIADPKAQARFAESVIGKPTEENRKDFTLKYANNNQEINDTQFKGLRGATNNLKLSKEDIESLKQFRQNYIEVDHGRILSQRETAQKVTSAEKQLAARPAYSTDNSATVDNASAVDGITDPNATKTIKVHVPLQNVEGSLDDKALTSYVQDAYGKPKTNLEGDNINTITNLAKLAGVKVLNAQPYQVGNRTWVTLELTVADQKKINNLYKKEQAEVNQQIDAMQKAADKTVAESFMRGFFKGAWNDLKGNGEMIYEVGKAVADPLGTANKIGKAIAEMPKFGVQVVNGISAAAREFSKMTPEQMNAFAKELISNGVKGLENLDGPALFERLGEIAGTVAMEAVLMKGAGAAASLAYKAFEATSVGAEFIKTAETVGQAVKSRVANFISDEAAAAAEKRFFARAKELGLSPNSITNIAVDPELWKSMTQIAANKIQKAAVYGGMKFEQFAKEMSGKFGEVVKPYLEKLYRDEMVSLNLKVDEKEIAKINDIWKAEETNAKIGISRTDEITGLDYAKRAEFRQQVHDAKWTPRNNKHFDPLVKSDPEALIFSKTGTDPAAQYLMEFRKGNKIQSMERRAMQEALQTGMFKEQGGTIYFFYKFDKPIGYNKGELTQWMRVELTGNNGTFHGFPANIQQIKDKFPHFKE